MTLRRYLLGVDVGTNGCKVTLINSKGEVLGSAFREYETYYPRPMWAEQNPLDWYEAFKITLQELTSLARVGKGEIACVGIDGQMHGPTFLNKDGKVLRPTIVWMDQRSILEVEWLKKEVGEEVWKVTGNPVTTTFTLPQLLWVKRHEPEVWKALYKVQVPKDYLRYRLTKEWVMDLADASGTLLLNIHKLEWSKEICEASGIEYDKLPQLAQSTDVAGYITKEASIDTGLPEEVPVVAGGSDVSAESLSTGLVKPNQCLIRLGTAGAIFVTTDKPYPDPKKRCFCFLHSLPGRWITVTGTQACGLSLRWFRDAFCREEVEEAKKLNISAYRLIDSEAAKAPVGSEGLIFHPYLMGERSPYWDPYLKGDFFGVTVRHRKEHFARAVLEGVAFSLLDCLKVFHELGLPTKGARIIGGGAKSDLWRRIICDVLGVEVTLPSLGDASFGAAMLAGVGGGIFKDEWEAVNLCVKLMAVEEPNMDNYRKYQTLFKIYRKVHDDLTDACRMLHQSLEKKLND